MIVFGAVPFVMTPSAQAIANVAVGTPENPHVYVGYTRDHRGITPADKARWTSAITKLEVDLGVARAAPVTPLTAGQVRRIEALINGMRQGSVAFVRFTNLVDGKEWGKYYDERDGSLEIRPIPPSSGWGFVGWIGNAIVWFGEQVTSALMPWCDRLNKATSNELANQAAYALIDIAAPGAGRTVQATIETAKKICMGVALVSLLTQDFSAPSADLEPEGWPRLSERVSARRPYPQDSFAVFVDGRYRVLAPPGALPGTGIKHDTSNSRDHR